jgi:hypothetical protein
MSSMGSAIRPSGRPRLHPQAHNRGPLLRCPRVHEPALQVLGVSEEGGASRIGVAAAPVFGTEHEVPDSDREEWVESP